MAIPIKQTRTVVLTTVEQTGAFYSAEFFDSEGIRLERTYIEDEFIEAIEFLNNLPIPIEFQEFTIDIS